MASTDAGAMRRSRRAPKRGRSVRAGSSTRMRATGMSPTENRIEANPKVRNRSPSSSTSRNCPAPNASRLVAM
jgi:hypothetical protein